MTDGELVKAQLVAIVSRLPEGTATLVVREQEDGTVIEMLPSRSEAAPLLVVVPNDARAPHIVIAGRGTNVEVTRTGTSDASAFDRVRAVCQAVIERGLVERLMLRGEEVVGARGTIDLPPPIVARWRQLRWRDVVGGRKELNVTYGAW